MSLDPNVDGIKVGGKPAVEAEEFNLSPENAQAQIEAEELNEEIHTTIRNIDKGEKTCHIVNPDNDEDEYFDNDLAEQLTAICDLHLDIEEKIELDPINALGELKSLEGQLVELVAKINEKATEIPDHIDEEKGVSDSPERPVIGELVTHTEAEKIHPPEATNESEQKYQKVLERYNNLYLVKTGEALTGNLPDALTERYSEVNGEVQRIIDEMGEDYESAANQLVGKIEELENAQQIFEKEEQAKKEAAVKKRQDLEAQIRQCVVVVYKYGEDSSKAQEIYPLLSRLRTEINPLLEDETFEQLLGRLEQSVKEEKPKTSNESESVPASAKETKTSEEDKYRAIFSSIMEAAFLFKKELSSGQSDRDPDRSVRDKPAVTRGEERITLTRQRTIDKDHLLGLSNLNFDEEIRRASDQPTKDKLIVAKATVRQVSDFFRNPRNLPPVENYGQVPYSDKEWETGRNARGEKYRVRAVMLKGQILGADFVAGPFEEREAREFLSEMESKKRKIRVESLRRLTKYAGETSLKQHRAWYAFEGNVKGLRSSSINNLALAKGERMEE